MSYGAIPSLFMGHLYIMMFTTCIYNCTYMKKCKECALQHYRRGITAIRYTYYGHSLFCNTCHCYWKSIWLPRFYEGYIKCTNLHCTVHTLLPIRSELCSIKSSNIIHICVWKCGSNQMPNAF